MFISFSERWAIRSYQLALAMYRKLVSLKRLSAEKSMHLLKDDEASPSVAISGGAPPSDPPGGRGSDPGCCRGDRCAACPSGCSTTAPPGSWSCCSPTTTGATTTCGLCTAAELSFVLPSCVAAIRTLQQLHSRPHIGCLGERPPTGHKVVKGHCCPSCWILSLLWFLFYSLLPALSQKYIFRHAHA